MESTPKHSDLEQKNFKKEETEWRNEKALYEQKIELLEILVKESKIREENLRKMNENLASALSDFAHDTKKFSNSNLKEIQIILDKNSQDYIQSKFKNNEVVKVLENEVKNLRELNDTLQNSRQEEIINLEREKLFLENKIRDLENEKNIYESTIKSFQEMQKNFGTSNYESQMKLNNQKEVLERLKQQHNNEIENLRMEHTQNLTELRSLYENEKYLIEDKLKSSQKLLKKFQRFDLTLRESVENTDKNLLEKENFELKRTIERLNEEHMDEIAKYLQKIEIMEKKIAYLSKERSLEEGSSKNTKTERYSEIQLKEALLNKEKDTSSSRQNFEEKSQNIPFIHETSIVNHKCENIHSNEMENLNMSKNENNCFDMFFKELSSRNDEKTPTCSIKPPIHKSISAQHGNFKQNFDNYESIHENEQNLDLMISENHHISSITSPKTLKEDLKKEGMSFTSMNNSKKPRVSHQEILLKKKYSEEFDLPNDHNRSIDLVIIGGNKEKENHISQKKYPQSSKNIFNSQNRNEKLEKSEQYEKYEKSIGRQQKSKTVATALLCEKCEETFQPQEFLEHLQFCHTNKQETSQIKSSRKEPTPKNRISNIYQSDEIEQITEENFFSVPNFQENHCVYSNKNPKNRSFSKMKENEEEINERENSQLYNVLENLNKEKNQIISQLKQVEDKLQKTQMDNEYINEEKENLQADLQALLSELKNTKMQMVYSAEEKKQAETLLKKEIKILIKKLIKTKGKLINQKNTSKLDCNNSSLVNLSGFINFYNQNKENSTFGDKTLDTQNNNCTETSFLNQSIHQVFSNSLFSLANRNSNKQRNNSQTKIYLGKSPINNKQIYSTPNKFENSHIRNAKGFNELNKKPNFQLFKSKQNDSTTTKPSKKINRYNNI